MDRVDTLRAARSSAHVSMSEYIKLRARCGTGVVLVFEGKQCPAVYIGWLNALFRKCGAVAGQIIARGKRNVLLLRELILRNAASKGDQNFYFVDRDYDVEPKQGSLTDVYVTRGYSIENELANWSAVESLIRAHFDIADEGDNEAVGEIARWYASLFGVYTAASREMHKVVYVCRTSLIPCLPGDDAFDFISVDWERGVAAPRYQSLDDLFKILKIEQNQWETVKSKLVARREFDALDPLMDWRGKFHFSFLKAFLVAVREARSTGKGQFRRASKVPFDPSHPGLMAALSCFVQPPPCLERFCST